MHHDFGLMKQIGVVVYRRKHKKTTLVNRLRMVEVAGATVLVSGKATSHCIVAVTILNSNIDLV